MLVSRDELQTKINYIYLYYVENWRYFCEYHIEKLVEDTKLKSHTIKYWLGLLDNHWPSFFYCECPMFWGNKVYPELKDFRGRIVYKSLENMKKCYKLHLDTIPKKR